MRKQMKRDPVAIVALLAVLLLATLPSVYPVRAAGSRMFALVIGIGQGYQHPNFQGLRFPEQDAQQMTAALEKLGFQVATLTGEKATMLAIKEAFDVLGQQANHPDDVVVVYYSGHGAIQRAADREVPSLVPSDADPRRRTSFISDTELGQWMGYIKSRKIMLILDACYSAGIGVGGEKRDTTPEQMSTQQVQARLRHIQQASFVGALFQSTVILASSQARETSKETSEPGMSGGIFTYYLLQGLGEERGASCPACAGGGNVITPQSWLQYAADGVASNVDQKPNLQMPSAGTRVALLVPWAKPGTVLPLPTAAVVTPRPSGAPIARPTPRPQPTPEPVVVHTPRPTTQQRPQPTGRVAPNSPQPPAGVPQAHFRFVQLPAGTFMMGSPANEPNRENDERQHQVALSRACAIQTTEVSQALWETVMGSNPSRFKGADLPVEQVSWTDVQDFIRKLNLILNTNVYRLPTEAEWEYAARAGTTTPYAGSLDAMAWYYQISGNRTHPAGQKQPNAWGLYDMHGNVWEWVQDWYGDYPSSNMTDPRGPSTGSDRVVRGGSWYNRTPDCRSANRSYGDPGDRGYYLGFRLARS